MKKFIFTSAISLTLLSSCSWIMGPDKNDLQPKLGGAGRENINPNFQTQNAMAMPQQPNQPEVFMNQGVGLGTAPAPDMMGGNPQIPTTPMDTGFMSNQPVQPMPMAMGQAMPPMPPQPDMYAGQPPMPQPVMIQQPMAPMMAPAPQQQMMAQAPTANLSPQVTGGEPVVVAQISKKKRLPASLAPTYNNPLNTAQVVVAQPIPVAIAPQPLLQQPMAQPIAQPYAPAPQQYMPAAGIPPAQPGSAPTMPVQQMQLYTSQPMPVK